MALVVSAALGGRIDMVPAAMTDPGAHVEDRAAPVCLVARSGIDEQGRTLRSQVLISQEVREHTGRARGAVGFDRLVI
jgi:hypothetical protein